MGKGTKIKGNCVYCGQELAKNWVDRHLAVCAPYQEIAHKATETPRAAESLHHLRVEAGPKNQFWLDVEMRGSASLQRLDEYLRVIWPEGGDHPSQFSMEGWPVIEISKNRLASDLLDPAVALTYLYDFGVATKSLIKVVGVRQGIPLSDQPIVLRVRNVPPVEECILCSEPATQLCLDCQREGKGGMPFCDAHAASHSHGQMVPLANSPWLWVGSDGA